LLVDDPWRVAMSTDHPNGGSFLAYPQIIRTIDGPDARRNAHEASKGVLKRCTLADLDREYTLNEIAIITRAPAKMLGLARKGHLGVGADGDVTIYSPNDDRQKMFELPRWVFRAGELVVENGEIRNPVDGKLFHVAPAYDEEVVPDIKEWFEKYYTIQFRNYPVDDHYLRENEITPTIPQ
jgi:formylmethanofuran dehydrogenase subunit A